MNGLVAAKARPPVGLRRGGVERGTEPVALDGVERWGWVVVEAVEVVLTLGSGEVGQPVGSLGAGSLGVGTWLGIDVESTVGSEAPGAAGEEELLTTGERVSTPCRLASTTTAPITTPESTTMAMTITTRREGMPSF